MYIAHIGSMYSRDLARQVNSNVRKGDSVTIFIFSVVHETLLCLSDITVFILSLTLTTSFKLKNRNKCRFFNLHLFLQQFIISKKKKFKKYLFCFFSSSMVINVCVCHLESL